MEGQRKRADRVPLASKRGRFRREIFATPRPAAAMRAVEAGRSP